LLGFSLPVLVSDLSCHEEQICWRSLNEIRAVELQQAQVDLLRDVFGIIPCTQARDEELMQCAAIPSRHLPDELSRLAQSTASHSRQ
jgi:hypothetical protein